MKARVWCLIALCLAAETYAAKKDFKGLFGSYRRERFTENEARPTDYGMDILLSTLLPITSVVNSNETPGATTGTPMSYATFFNVESSFFFTLNYNWQLYLNFGYYSYDTRRQNSGAAQFQMFTMEAIPVVLGAKYRFGTSDIVPYIGGGIGGVYSYRKGFFDYVNSYNEVSGWGLAAQLSGGAEFYISARTGIRLEVAAMYMGLSGKNYTTATYPSILYQPNNFAVRYASGVFFLF
jgi:outer membrane protein W